MNPRNALDELRSDGRYSIDESALRELGLSMADLEALAGRTRPLGMTNVQYKEFCEELTYALERDGISDADIRMQGSSVNLYSNQSKRMPFQDSDPFAVDRALLLQEMSTSRGRLPNGPEVRHAESSLMRIWPSVPRPSRRPFDSLFLCGVHGDRSDYDIQISSDQMIDRVRKTFERLGVDLDAISVADESYAFVRKCYTEDIFLYVSQWCMRQSEYLDRTVAWVLFPSCGPTQASAGRQSSHFRSTDWIISATPTQLGVKHA